MINIEKLKSLGWSILGVFAFYAIVALASWGLYEITLEKDLGLDLDYINFLGLYGIVLLLNIVTKLTFNDTKRTNIS